MNISSLMREYLTESTQSEIQNSLFGTLNTSLPVEIEKKPAWQTLENPQRLRRSFEFSDPKQLLQFIIEVVNYEKSVRHNGSILIEALEVNVEVYTHTVDEVTELDIEYANELSKIYRDVKDYEYRR